MVWMSLCCWLTQPVSTAEKQATSAKAPARHCNVVFMTLLSPVISAPLCLISRAKHKQFFQQLGIADSRGLGRLREVLFGREVGVRIRFDHVDLALGVHAVVDTRASRETQRAIDATR